MNYAISDQLIIQTILQLPTYVFKQKRFAAKIRKSLNALHYSKSRELANLIVGRVDYADSPAEIRELFDKIQAKKKKHRVTLLSASKKRDHWLRVIRYTNALNLDTRRVKSRI